MSTLAYATLTARREEIPSTTSAELVAADNPAAGTSSGLSTFVDAMAALVPAEVLAIHALVLSAAQATSAPNTASTGGISTDPIPTITASSPLAITFWVLFIVTIVLYAVPHFATRGKRFEKADYFRMVLPALAFTAWTMLQRPSAFDAVAPKLDAVLRLLFAAVLAILVVAAAKTLAEQANKQPPTPPPPPGGSSGNQPPKAR